MERLEVHINNAYDNNSKLVSTAQIWEGNAKVSEWQTNDPRAIIHKGVEAADENVFEQVRIKKKIEEVARLFEPIKITIKGK
jgi:hypothetical protein